MLEKIQESSNISTRAESLFIIGVVSIDKQNRTLYILYVLLADLRLIGLLALFTSYVSISKPKREHAVPQSTQENIIMRVLPPKPLYATEGYATSLNHGCGVQCS